MARTALHLGLAVWLLVLAACGDVAAVVPSIDAGTATDVGFVVAPAALPVLTPCPTGWREVPPSGAHLPATCEPYAASGPEACARGSAHFPGTSGCLRLGPTCPTGDFADDLPSDRELRFVRPSADLSATGTRERPYASLAEAVRRAPSGAVLALAKGTYVESVAFPLKDFTLIGACLEETILQAPAPATERGILGGGGGHIELRRLTFTGPSPAIIAIDSVVFDLEDVLIDRVAFVALYALLGGTIEGRRVVVQDTQELDGFGRALTAQEGGRIALSQAVLSGQREIAAMALDPGSSLALEDARLTSSRPSSGGLYGRALDVEDGATLTLSRVIVDDNAEYGLFSGQVGSVATLTDVVVRDVGLDANGAFGRGLHAQSGGAIRAKRVLVDGAREVGIHATAAANPAGDALTLDDVVVRRVGANAAGFGGRGVQVQWGALLTAHRLHVSELSEIGVLIATEDARAVIEDVTVLDLRGGETGRLGHGLSAIEGAELRVSRAHVARVLDVGVMIASGASFDAEDLTIEQIESERARGQGGIGLYSQDGVVNVRRTSVRDVRQLGVGVDGPLARLTALGLLVDGVRDAGCATTTCTDLPSGVGLGAYVAGAAIEVSDFVVMRCALAGVQVAGGVADLARGRVSDNPIGANVQTAGFDFARLTTDVVFERNERAFDGNLLPIPETRLPGALAF